MKIAEIAGIKPIKPLTPDQAKIDSLQKQKDAAADRLKRERDRQKRQRAMQQLASLNNPLNVA
jgi:membrane protein insertase Oxa1/YidC/SpoIIIJ